MKKILCPTDFSLSAETAVSYAAKLAQQTGASIHLLHMDLLSDLTPEEVLFGGGSDSAQLLELLDKECTEVARVFKVSCYEEPMASGTSLSKHMASLEQEYELIVMGTNGEDTIMQKMFGSNTYAVIRRTTVPLLIVPEKCGFSRITNIAYAFDYWRIHEVPMKRMVQFAKSVNARLTLVDVMERYSREAEKDLLATQAELRAAYGDDVALDFKVLYNDDIKVALNEYMATGACDVLGLCFRDHGLSGLPPAGLIRQLSREMSYPVLIVH